MPQKKNNWLNQDVCIYKHHWVKRVLHPQCPVCTVQKGRTSVKRIPLTISPSLVEQKQGAEQPRGKREGLRGNIKGDTPAEVSQLWSALSYREKFSETKRFEGICLANHSWFNKVYAIVKGWKWPNASTWGKVHVHVCLVDHTHSCHHMGSLGNQSQGIRIDWQHHLPTESFHWLRTVAINCLLWSLSYQC